MMYWKYLRYVLGTLLCVRALTIEALRHVAIVAEHLKPWGIPFVFKPLADVVALWDRFSMRVSATIFMVDAQEFDLGFATARTGRGAFAVMLQSSHAKLALSACRNLPKVIRVRRKTALCICLVACLTPICTPVFHIGIARKVSNWPGQMTARTIFVATFDRRVLDFCSYLFPRTVKALSTEVINTVLPSPVWHECRFRQRSLTYAASK